MNGIKIVLAKTCLNIHLGCLQKRSVDFFLTI